MSALSAVVGGPVRVALAPLAWLLAAVDVAVRRPSVLFAGTVLLMCVPTRITDISASGHITAADLGAGAAVAVTALGRKILVRS